jgi:hypothetical protein
MARAGKRQATRAPPDSPCQPDHLRRTVSVGKGPLRAGALGRISILRTRSLSAVIAVCILGLGACATPYQEMGLTGGVSATQLTSDTFQIVAKGNGYTSSSAIERYALRKAAEVTVANGYDLFLIASAADRGRVSGFTTNSQYNGGGYSSGFATPIYTPGQTLMVKTFRGPKPADAPPNLYDARELLSYLVPPPAKDD